MHSPKIQIKQRFIITSCMYSSCWYMHHSRLLLKAPFQHADLNRHRAKKAQWSGMVSIISYQTMCRLLFHAWLCPLLQFVRVPFFSHIPSILQVPGSKGKLELMYCCSQPDLGCAPSLLWNRRSLLPWLLLLSSSWLSICSQLQCLLFAFCSLRVNLRRMYKVQTLLWEAGSVSWVMIVNSTLETGVHAAVSATRLVPNKVPGH